MLDEWLSIAEKTKMEEAVESCESHTDDIYQELVCCLNVIKGENPNFSDLTNTIENLFIIKTRRDVNFIFSRAIQDGISIGKCLR